MLFTSGPATIGPGVVVDSDYSHAIRSHQDIGNGYAPYYQRSCEFYKRLCDSSAELDLFACSLDQVGAAELKVPVECSGGFMMLGESFDSEQFRKCQKLLLGLIRKLASVMARIAMYRTERMCARDVISWLDKNLIHFASKFGEYVQEDPSSFRLASNFSLYPQFMYHLRRSQFIDVFNSTPDETAFFRLILNCEGVVGSLIMIKPTLFQYSFEGPPIPVLLDVCSIFPDVILLFDSYLNVVIHYGSKIAQ